MGSGRRMEEEAEVIVGLLRERREEKNLHRGGKTPHCEEMVVENESKIAVRIEVGAVRTETDVIRIETDEVRIETDEVRIKTDEVRIKTDAVRTGIDEARKETNLSMAVGAKALPVIEVSLSLHPVIVKTSTMDVDGEKIAMTMILKADQPKRLEPAHR